METKSPFQQSAQPVYPGSAPLRLFKVEAGINGLLPTSWAPPIYSVSLLSKLCFALGGNGLLRQAAARSFLAHSCKRKNRPNQQKKPVRGLDNVGFIAASRLTQAGSKGPKEHSPARGFNPGNHPVRRFALKLKGREITIRLPVGNSNPTVCQKIAYSAKTAEFGISVS